MTQQRYAQLASMLITGAQATLLEQCLQWPAAGDTHVHRVAMPSTLHDVKSTVHCFSHLLPHTSISHTSCMQVSTFIVLAKEQAEQEQLARQQQRHQYNLQHMGMHAGPTSYVLPQQAFLLQQQQHASMACAMAPVPAWTSSVAPNSTSGLSSMAGAPAQHAGFSTEQQHMQAWVPAGTPAVMQQSPLMEQQQVGMQLPGQMAPAGTYVSMHVLASPSASVAASTAMLLSTQQPQVQQQFVLQAVSVPAQQAGLAAVPMSAVTNAPTAAQVRITGTHELSLLQQASGQLAAGESSPSACSIGGHAFVQDMLSSLSYAAAGQNLSTAQGILIPPAPAVPWAQCESTSSAVVAGGSTAQWSVGQTTVAGAHGLISASPAYSATSSTSANTSTGYVLPARMCPVSSPVCA